ncbi:MAG: rpsH [Caloramator sp.]|jgi:small subunit ribosomal protein S8|uniref:Small ribosomal subunit protein uS8 n=1 Tax=Caloramator proteoclasticus DSM 10124 TaxID=1121262 RepID=A0A1M4VQY7_9CLOT|nr:MULTISPECIES: 30S ribosomal protein S8 [Caloramator]MBZ4663304.1 rpsH [Caloramator sp.]SHE71369.1 small subunit ribosomal protein S8 [Caloramator proteoclasticus DSM 10124]
MVMTDPIADMLTRIRNANIARKDFVEFPASKIKKAIAQIMLEEGYIANLEEYMDGSVPMLRVTLKYGQNRERVITGVRRISKPGLRVYAQKDNIPKVLGGLGTAILSTSKGIVTDKVARKEGVGGEVICYIW